MIRTLVTAAALSVAMAPAALAQGHAYGSEGHHTARGVPGVTVQVQPSDAYVIRLSTRGKDAPTVNREITRAAWTACRLAPRTGDTLEMRPSAMSSCAGEAIHDARMQFARILDLRRAGYLRVAAY